MKTKAFMIIAICGMLFSAGLSANAQPAVAIVEETVSVSDLACKTHFYSNSGDNWFIQFGAGIQSPFVENYLPKGDAKHHLTTVYGLGLGKWFSPYIGWRLSFSGGSLHWDNDQFNHAKTVSGSFDLMWDMFNSLGGVNPSRVFSIVPFAGMGGAFTWDYKPSDSPNIEKSHGHLKRNAWTLPVSAGLQLRFRLCRYADFFAEGRAQFAGDNYNLYAYGKPIDINISCTGGFIINIGGSDFHHYNPCNYVGHVANLNSQVNDLRAALATTAAALAVAESQLPCPDAPAAPAVQPVATTPDATPLIATVRFTINSAVISSQEMVNVYNVAQWMDANPSQNVAIVGYADKDTGTADYNMALSIRRAQAVFDALVNEYGISPDRLSMDAAGSNIQPYGVNSWNRIVIFTNAQ